MQCIVLHPINQSETNNDLESSENLPREAHSVNLCLFFAHLEAKAHEVMYKKVFTHPYHT